MQITHPQCSYNGLPPEDVFMAMDEQGTHLGVGSIIYQYLPSRSPECPVNMYFDINSTKEGRYLLLGALVARARQLRERVPDRPARLYTRIEPDDMVMRKEYEESGFDCSPAETLMQLYMPQGDGRIPMSCTLQPTSLNTQQELLGLLDRLRRNDITHLDPGLLEQLRRMPHFTALGLLQGDSLVGEIMAAGAGDSCELVAVYINEPFRRQGMGTLLVHRCMAVMAAEGVTKFGAAFVGLSLPQIKLAKAFSAQDRQIRGIFPQLEL